MAVINEIVNKLERHKNLEVNLPEYVNEMMNLYYNMSGIKLSMNYYTFSEIYEEDGFSDSKILTYRKELVDILSMLLSGKSILRDELYARLISLRTNVIADMEIITAYTDAFKIYEYMVNRVEGRFSEQVLDDAYYHDGFKVDMIKYIFQDKQNSNLRISEIVSQLPVRITKNKFYERIMGAFSLYKESDRAAFDELVYMIRTEAFLAEPEGFSENYPSLYEMLKNLEGIDYKNITKEELDKARDILEIATDSVSAGSDDLIRFAELVNDTIIILLSGQYITREDENVKMLLSSTYDYVEGKKKLADLIDLFPRVEGIQETLYSYINSAEGIIADYKDDEILDVIMLKTQFENLSLCNKLSSGSIFIKLDDAEDNSIDANYIASEYDKLIKDFEECFKDKSVMHRRAIMSAVLGQLPNYFKSMDEIKDYIDTALSCCSDDAERIGTVNIIKDIISM